jgi:DNA adenine methylase
MSRPIEKLIEPLGGPFEQIVADLIEGEGQESFSDFPKQYPRSPLRYPGGKQRAVKSIYSFIPKSETKLCSPFLGGASIELACTTRMQVHGADIFEPLIAFWRVLLSNPDKLIARVRSYLPLTRTRFYSTQKHFIHLTDEVERAAAFFVLNRSSFSGTTLSGGMSPNHPRFTESAITRLQDFKANNFVVECADFKDVIPRHRDDFLYLDPPYKNGQALYGVNGDTHKGFDHDALAELLKKRDRWIMSYNDCEEIRSLYRGYPILSPEWIYGMSKNKQSNEVLVLSRDLAYGSLPKRHGARL